MGAWWLVGAGGLLELDDELLEVEAEVVVEGWGDAVAADELADGFVVREWVRPWVGRLRRVVWSRPALITPINRLPRWYQARALWLPREGACLVGAAGGVRVAGRTGLSCEGVWACGSLPAAGWFWGVFL